MMKSIVLAAAMSFAGFLAGSLAPTAAWAQSCEVQAVERKLAGAAKTSFMKKCEADTAANSCDGEATARKLAGAARTSFMKKCEAGRGVEAKCEAQATERKLAGAAKASFTKKCVAGG